MAETDASRLQRASSPKQWLTVPGGAAPDTEGIEARRWARRGLPYPGRPRLAQPEAAKPPAIADVAHEFAGARRSPALETVLLRAMDAQRPLRRARSLRGGRR